MPLLHPKIGIDFSDYIADRTLNFTGREWVFEAIQNWLADPKGDRFFLLTGEPGSGKTAIAARLAQFAQGAKTYPGFEAGFCHAVHFCSATHPTWIDPRDFVEAIAVQLGQIPAYAKALVNVGEKQINIQINQNIGKAERNNITAVSIQTLDVSGLISPQELFNLIVLNPLQEIYQHGFNQPITILVDSLDEALTHSGQLAIVDLLAKLQGISDRVRFLLTSRPQPEILERFENDADIYNLTTGEGLIHSSKDISLYVSEILNQQPALQQKLSSELTTDVLITQIARNSEGNFLYVSYLLQMLLSQPVAISRSMLTELPIGLAGIYRSFLQRLVQGDKQTWRRNYAPLLGILAVAQAALTREQLAGFVQLKKPEVLEILETLRQFLDTDESLPASQRTYAIYHRSLADWLLDEDKAEGYWCDPVEQHERIIDYYRAEANNWNQTNLNKLDDYGLRYLATHLAETAKISSLSLQHQYTKSLVELIKNPDFQGNHQAKLQDLAALQHDVDRALRIVSVDPDPLSFPLVIEMALASISFQKTWLSPEPIFELARQGNIEAAEKRLNLFAMEPEWYQVAALTIAWLAAEQNPSEAKHLRDRLEVNLLKEDPFPLLLNRLDAYLENQSVFNLQSLPGVVSDEVIQAILMRMGGVQNDELLANAGIEPLVNPSLLLRPSDGTPFYVSEQDGPLLVAYTLANPFEGSKYLQQYLDIHAAYNYQEYRNRSLMVLLKAILQHPDQLWVKELLSKVVCTALTSSNQEFQKGLSLTFIGLQSLTGDTEAVHQLDEYFQSLTNKIELIPDDSSNIDNYST
jgi:AAA domain